MDHSVKKTYLLSLDVLRVLAILAVILIHQTTTTLQVLDHNIEIAPLSLLLNQAARFAVPVLFLISGFVLELNSARNLSYLTFFRKRASRILVPYIFWSILYFSLWQGFSVGKIVSSDFLLHLINGTSSYHLYFIPTLIIFYILFPFLHNLINIIKNPAFLISIFILQIAIAFYNYYFQVIPVQESLRVAILTFSLFVIGMGSVHHKDKIVQFAKKYFSVIATSLGLLIVGIFIHVLNLIKTNLSTGYIYNQYGPLNYFYTILIALFVTHYFDKRDHLKKLVALLSSLSFFVFFIHVLLLQHLWVFVLAELDRSLLSSFFFDPFVFISVASTTFLTGYLVHKIPYVSKITG